MEPEFPSVLFPCFYNTDPPDTALGHCAGSWGSHRQLTHSGTRSFRAQYTVSAESWIHTEPVPVPLLPPKHSGFCSDKRPHALDFSEHLQSFFVDHPSDAFGSMAHVLGQTLHFKNPPHKRARKAQDPIRMWEVSRFRDKLQSKICTRSAPSSRLDAFSRLLSDAVHSVPVELLGSLLYEELHQQSRDAMFCEANTGGALDLIPLSQTAQDSARDAALSGCLVYSANGVDKLNFQQVELQSRTVVCSKEVCSFILKGPIQQISSRTVCGLSLVSVRSLYQCGVWTLPSAHSPQLLQSLSSAETLTCTSLSPHVVGELLVASESGATHLWRLGHGMQLVRSEDSNLYFNSQSSWRWCEFSAHPRVMLYADRTGVELTDIRVQPSSCHTLFRISQASECKSEKDCCNYSAYIMDERFPCVPVLKCDHMMEAPPVFCQVLPSSHASLTERPPSCWALRGLKRSLSCSTPGGAVEACVSRGPVQTLHRPTDSVKLLPTQLPHRTQASQDRLSHPATGLTAVRLQRSASEESLCVLQLLQTGDVFYQILEKDTCAEAEATALGSHSLSIWKQWLQRLAHKSKPSHSVVKGRLRTPQSETQRSSKHLLRTSTHIEWTDPLSSRLTASWAGEEAWHVWWNEHLGADRAEKTQALRRRRRKEKEVKRASGRSLLALSGSFTSSCSYQSDLSDWAWSDSGGVGSQSEDPPTDMPTDTTDQHRLTPVSALQRPLWTVPGLTRESASLWTVPALTGESASLWTVPALTESPLCGQSRTDRKARPPVDSPSADRRAPPVDSPRTDRRERPPVDSPRTDRRAQQTGEPPVSVESNRDAFSWSQNSSQRLSQFFSQSSQSSQRKKKSRMGF
ncbi:hypothetical protein WMY93_021080 [Mugilogobius chulae]|uniref:Uncharacterized protein n=1 Tax=Mugilogobius chulae TaxID=88201 RepID=A0AAW0NB78_9GOBI